MNTELTGLQRDAARVLWNYHKLGHVIGPDYDLMLVGGSHDLRVADCAVALLAKTQVRVLVVSGGFGKVTATEFSRPEAEIFAERMVRGGVPIDRIVLETRARNSAENITLTKNLVTELEAQVRTGLLVTKPYMERRFFATAQRQWSEVHWTVTSPSLSFEEYPTPEVPRRRMLELMVGDLQRLHIYAERGYQVEQHIPDEVWAAYHILVDSGFTAQLLK